MSDTKYPPKIAFWPTKNGKPQESVFVDDEVLSILQSAQKGGRLLLEAVPEKYRTSPKSPTRRMSFLPPNDGPPPAAKDEGDAF